MTAINHNKQQGIALITAVLIVSLVTVAASAMASRQLLDIRRTENILHSDQAYVNALAAEQLVAKVIVVMDPNKDIDHEAEWALLNEAGAIPVNDTLIAVRLRDVTGSFPINSLVGADGKQQEHYYKALNSLITLALEDSFAPELPAAIMDWVDPNQDITAGGGAEDMDYLNKAFPYRTANGPIASLSELRLVSGMLADDYIKLVPRDGRPPFINSLPADTPININTAPKEVLMSLHEKIDEALIDEIMAERIEAQEKMEAPYKEVQKFINDILDAQTYEGKDQAEKDKNRKEFEDELKKFKLSVGSQYFEVTTVAQVGRTEVQLHSLLKREKDQVTTIRRGIGVY